MVQISVPENRARALVSRHREIKSSSNKIAAVSSSDTPLNTRKQSLRKPPIQTQNFRSKCEQSKGKYLRSSKISKEGKEARLKEGGGGRRGGQKGWPYRHLLPPADTQAWASREGRTGTRPYQKSDQNGTRIQLLCQEEVISLQSSAQAEALRSSHSCVQDRGTSKKGKDRKG